MSTSTTAAAHDAPFRRVSVARPRGSRNRVAVFEATATLRCRQPGCGRTIAAGDRFTRRVRDLRGLPTTEVELFPADCVLRSLDALTVLAPVCGQCVPIPPREYGARPAAG